MKKPHLTMAVSFALCCAMGMACSKPAKPETEQPAPVAEADDSANDSAKKDDIPGHGFMPPPFGNSYKREIAEICDNGKDDDNDGKSDCDDRKCVGHVSCIATVAPTVDESACVALNLASPKSSNSNVVVEKEKKALTIQVKADKKICLKLTGTYDGRVAIENNNDIDMDVILDNVKILSEKMPGTLKLNSANKNKGNHFVIKLVGDNRIEGGATKDSKRVLACDANLDVIGDGSLTVVSRYKTAIGVDDVMHVWSGNIDVRVERDNKNTDLKEKGYGLKIDNGFIQSGGVVKVTGRDELKGYETRGLVVDGSESAYGAGKGYVVITDGELQIETDAKALSADWSLSNDAKTDNTDDDPYPDLTITGGKVYVHTYSQPRESRHMGGPGGPGMPPGFKDAKPSDFENVDLDRMPPEIAEAIRQFRDGETDTLVLPPPPPPPGMQREVEKNADGTEMASVSPEGIEAKGHMYLKGGEIVSIATDDGINVGGELFISGGTIYARSTNNDAIDANGKIHVSGGTTIVFGSSEPEGGFDADFSTNVSYSGGVVFAMGGENNAPGTIDGDASFVQYALVEKRRRGPGGMHGPGGPGGMHGPGGPGGMHGPGGPGGMHGPGGPGHREKTKSVLAGKTIAVTAKDSDKVIVAAKVPEDYTGGGNLLVMSDNIRKDADYLIYTDATLAGADKWFNEALLMNESTATGTEPKETKGGVATASHMGPPPGMGGPGGMRGPGGHGGMRGSDSQDNSAGKEE